MTRLIVFDCDGTLVDSQHLILAAAERAFAAEGLAPPPPADVHEIIGLTLEVAIAVLLPDADPVLRARLVERYRAAWRGLRAEGVREPLYPGTLATLRELDRRGHLLGVATGKSRSGLDSVLAHHRLSSLFASLQTADRHPSKPHPSMLEAAMRETGAAPADTLMVGDTSYDMTMAHAAGVGAIGVAWGYHPVEVLAKAGAATILERFEDLLGLVEGGTA
jgi:phosphoglycolate phosphatase